MSSLEEFEINNIENIKLKLGLTTPGVWLWSPYDNSVWSPEANKYLAGVEIYNDVHKHKGKQYSHNQGDMRFIADSKEDTGFLVKVIEKLILENKILSNIIYEATQPRPGKHV